MADEWDKKYAGFTAWKDEADSSMEPAMKHPEGVSDEDIEDLGEDFDFEGFQVVRREFFAHMNEPSISFCDYKFSVNTACLKKFPSVDFVQVLVNPVTRIVALRPCSEYSRDAVAWCKDTKGKRVPKQTTCKLLLAKLVSLLGWDPINRYKLLGKLTRANGEYLIAFDLNSVEVYVRTPRENGKPKSSRIPSYPSDWKDQFGMSFTEHKQSMRINTFEGYAIFSVKDEKQYETDQRTKTAQTTEA